MSVSHLSSISGPILSGPIGSVHAHSSLAKVRLVSTADRMHIKRIYDAVLATRGNTHCADCGARLERFYACLNLGLVVCEQCGEMHRRELAPSKEHDLSGTLLAGCHSDAKLILPAEAVCEKDAYSQAELLLCLAIGNAAANAVLESKLSGGRHDAMRILMKPTADSPSKTKLDFILAKYKRLEYAEAGKVSTESEDMLQDACDGLLPNLLQLVAGERVNLGAVPTILHHTVRANQPLTAYFLVRFGCDIHGVDREGNTPLHIAAQASSCDAARVLLFFKADKKLLNTYGQTPEELCPPTSEVHALLHGGTLLVRELPMPLLGDASSSGLPSGDSSPKFWDMQRRPASAEAAVVLSPASPPSIMQPLSRTGSSEVLGSPPPPLSLRSAALGHRRMASAESAENWTELAPHGAAGDSDENWEAEDAEWLTADPSPTYVSLLGSSGQLLESSTEFEPGALQIGSAPPRSMTLPSSFSRTSGAARRPSGLAAAAEPASEERKAGGAAEKPVGGVRSIFSLHKSRPRQEQQSKQPPQQQPQQVPPVPAYRPKVALLPPTMSMKAAASTMQSALTTDPGASTQVAPIMPPGPAPRPVPAPRSRTAASSGDVVPGALPQTGLGRPALNKSVSMTAVEQAERPTPSPRLPRRSSDSIPGGSVPSEHGNGALLPSVPEGASEHCVVLFPFTARNSEELTVSEGECVSVTTRGQDFCLVRSEASGHQGLVPTSYIGLN
jgi:hypothetical protein